MMTQTSLMICLLPILLISPLLYQLQLEFYDCIRDGGSPVSASSRGRWLWAGDLCIPCVDALLIALLMTATIVVMRTFLSRYFLVTSLWDDLEAIVRGDLYKYNAISLLFLSSLENIWESFSGQSFSRICESGTNNDFSDWFCNGIETLHGRFRFLPTCLDWVLGLVSPHWIDLDSWVSVAKVLERRQWKRVLIG